MNLESKGSGIIYIPRSEDKDTFDMCCANFENKTNEELIEAYNHSVDMGLVSARGQAIQLLAIARHFKERFGKIPLSIENLNTALVIRLTGRIRAVGESWEYAEEPYNLDKKDEETA